MKKIFAFALVFSTSLLLSAQSFLTISSRVAEVDSINTKILFEMPDSSIQAVKLAGFSDSENIDMFTEYFRTAYENPGDEVVYSSDVVYSYGGLFQQKRTAISYVHTIKFDEKTNTIVGEKRQTKSQASFPWEILLIGIAMIIHITFNALIWYKVWDTAFIAIACRLGYIVLWLLTYLAYHNFFFDDKDNVPVHEAVKLILGVVGAYSFIGWLVKAAVEDVYDDSDGMPLVSIATCVILAAVFCCIFAELPFWLTFIITIGTLLTWLSLVTKVIKQKIS